VRAVMPGQSRTAVTNINSRTVMDKVVLARQRGQN
jgi:hypothetical protein